MSALPVVMQGVSFRYPGADRPALEDISVEVGEGELACVIGPNGGGKTTFIRLVLGLLHPQHGSIRVFGENPDAVRTRIGYLPQRLEFDPQFPVSVRDVVLMGRLHPRGLLGFFSRRDHERAGQALAEVGLPDLAERPFGSLSGGQRQRVLIARALACDPDLLVLDEPTASLDIAAEEQIYELLGRLNERLTVLVVSHDVSFVSSRVTKAICVNRHVHVHAHDQLSDEIIEGLYGRQIRTLHHTAADCCDDESHCSSADG